MSIRTQYDSDLEALKAALAEMGRSSADAVEDALEALCTADADAAAGIVKDDGVSHLAPVSHPALLFHIMPDSVLL